MTKAKEPEQTVSVEDAPQPPKDPVPDQADPDDPIVVEPEPDGPVDPEDPNTYPDENAPRGGGPLTTRKGP